MHAAVLVALFCFYVVTKMLLGAYSEMTWLKEEPFMIIQISSLKPTVMLLSSGLLLIFVILCVVSFIEARKNRVAEEAKKAKLKPAKKEHKEKVIPKTDSDDKKSKESIDSKKEDRKDSKKPSGESKTSSSSSSEGKSPNSPAPKDTANKSTPANEKKDTQIKSDISKDGKSEPSSEKEKAESKSAAPKVKRSNTESTQVEPPPSQRKEEPKEKPSNQRPSKSDSIEKPEKKNSTTCARTSGNPATSPPKNPNSLLNSPTCSSSGAKTADQKWQPSIPTTHRKTTGETHPHPSPNAPTSNAS